MARRLPYLQGSGCIVSASHSMPLISAWMLFPLLNPYLRRDAEGKSGERSSNAPNHSPGGTSTFGNEGYDEDDGQVSPNGDDPELLLGALAEALNLKEYV